MLNIKIQEIFPGLIHLHFKTQYEVTSTMLRLQEFYESPYENIRDKYFDLEDYMDTYAKHKENFTYTIDWSGFNIPGNVVNKFFKIFDEKLLAKEAILKNTINKAKADIGIKDSKFYLIASYDDDLEGKDVLKHEIAHGLYYLNEEYKEKMEKVIMNISDNERNLLAERLLDEGYFENVIFDEMQAYFSTSEMLQLVEDFNMEGLSWSLPWESVLKCKQIFEDYYSKIEDYQP